MQKYLAIITARSGSKRLPGKNVRVLAGQPMFVWSIRAALSCERIARTIVSTDSPAFQQIAVAAGAECSWLRDSALASDEATSADVVQDVLDRLDDDVRNYRAFVLLQPTSPLRTAEDVSGALALYEERNATAVLSVSEAECPPAWMGQLPDSLEMDNFARTQLQGVPSQDLGQWYRINGAIYVVGIEEFQRERTFRPRGALAYIMPRNRSIDVDTPFDLKLVELLLGASASEHET